MSEKPPDELEGIVYVGEDGEEIEVVLPEGTTDEEAEAVADSLAQATGGEVTPESLDAHLEEKVVDMPSLTTAAALLDDDPLADIPVEDPDDETPPDPTPLTDKLHGPRGTEKRDAWEREQREKAAKAEAEIAAHPAIQKAMAQEQVRLAQKKAIQEAFIKAQKPKA